MTADNQPRIRPLAPSQLDAAQRQGLRRNRGRPAGRSRGSPGRVAAAPGTGRPRQRLGEYARYGTSLPPVLSELAILVVARTWGSEFEWLVHKPIALAAGVSPDAVEAIRCGDTPLLEDPAQSAVYAFCAALLREHHVDDPVYADAVGALGETGVVDLVGILGYYSLISMTINAFRVPPPEGAEPELAAEREAAGGRPGGRGAAGRPASTEPSPS